MKRRLRRRPPEVSDDDDEEDHLADHGTRNGVVDVGLAITVVCSPCCRSPVAAGAAVAAVVVVAAVAQDAVDIAWSPVAMDDYAQASKTTELVGALYTEGYKHLRLTLCQPASVDIYACKDCTGMLTSFCSLPVSLKAPLGTGIAFVPFLGPPAAIWQHLAGIRKSFALVFVDSSTE